MRRAAIVGVLVNAACFSTPPGGGGGEAGSSTGAATGPAGSDGVVDSSGGTTTVASSSSDDGAVEETGVPPTCGNGMIDEGEDCDDDNDVPLDGCNDCRASGHVLWTNLFGAPAAEPEACNAITTIGADPGAPVVFVAGTRLGASDQVGWIAGLDGGGTQRWEDRGDTTSELRDLTVVPDGQLVAAGMRHTGSGDQGWAVRIATSGVASSRTELVWASGSQDSEFSAVASLEDALVFGGVVLPVGNDVDPWIGVLPLLEFPSSNFGSTWVETDGSVATAISTLVGTGDHVRAVLRTKADPAVVRLGWSDDRLATALATIEMPATDAPIAIAVGSEGTTAVCRSGGGGTPGVHVAVYDPGGAIVREADVGLGAAASCRDMAQLELGRILIGGDVGMADATAPFVAELSAALELRWRSDDNLLDGGAGAVLGVAPGPGPGTVVACGRLATMGSTQAFAVELAR